MLIDSMKLAYETFQHCRHLTTEAEALLAALIPTLEEVQEAGTLVLEVPDSRVRSLSTYCQGEIKCGPIAERRWPVHPNRAPLLRLCSTAAVEFSGLLATGPPGAVCSLGYALHIVPNLIASGEAIDPAQFQFNFRVAAFYWNEFSARIRQALADAASLDLDRADELAKTDGFPVDMYRFDPN